MYKALSLWTKKELEEFLVGVDGTALFRREVLEEYNGRIWASGLEQGTSDGGWR